MGGGDGCIIVQREELSCDWIPTKASATQGAKGGFHSLLSAVPPKVNQRDSRT